MENLKQRLFLIKLVLCFVSATAWGQEKDDLIPDAIIVQHAGSIGFVSGGIGYELFKKGRGSLDICYGYVPNNQGGELHTGTAKFAYRPVEISLGNKVTIYPFNPGVFFAYTFGENLSFSFDKKQYSRGYYGWSEALRSHLSVTNEVEFKKIGGMAGRGIKALSVYSEFNASDLYLVSWATNTDGLPFFEIVKLGIGVRLKF